MATAHFDEINERINELLRKIRDKYYQIYNTNDGGDVLEKFERLFTLGTQVLQISNVCNFKISNLFRNLFN